MVDLHRRASRHHLPRSEGDRRCGIEAIADDDHIGERRAAPRRRRAGNTARETRLAEHDGAGATAGSPRHTWSATGVTTDDAGVTASSLCRAIAGVLVHQRTSSAAARIAGVLVHQRTNSAAARIASQRPQPALPALRVRSASSTSLTAPASANGAAVA